MVSLQRGVKKKPIEEEEEEEEGKKDTNWHLGFQGQTGSVLRRFHRGRTGRLSRVCWTGVGGRPSCWSTAHTPPCHTCDNGAAITVWVSVFT